MLDISLSRRLSTYIECVVCFSTIHLGAFSLTLYTLIYITPLRILPNNLYR